MAEGFEPYHVPQQSRRDKLRVIAQNHPSCLEPTGFLPLSYDPSLLSSDLLTCAAAGGAPLSGPGENCVSKEEGMNLMGLVGGIVNGTSSSTSSSSTFRNQFLDPHSSLPLNPGSIHDINNNPFLYSSQNLQNLRDFDHQGSFNGGHEVVVFKPEPLSLSLSSNHTHQNNNLPLELNLQRYGGSSAIYSPAGIVGSASSDGGSRSSVPLGPFTGYASILKESRFLKPAQQMLEELCDVGSSIYGEKLVPDSSLLDPPMEALNAAGISDDQLCVSGDGESRKKKSRLISMLDEVYRRYKQYYQQMQAVVTSFEYVSGLGNAAPYANLAVKSMTRHFRCLKNAIMDQLQFTNKDNAHTSHGKDEAQIFRSSSRGPYGQRPGHSSGFLEHQPVWRPQRGLPERAVTVLRAWLFEHFLHPYPTDTDKMMLAKQTGLSRSQVSNWFINARVRLWKPMVEEIHMLETRQGQKSSQRDERSGNRSSEHLPSASSLVSENASTSIHRVHDTTSKRSRNELTNIPAGSEHMNLSYNNLPSHLQVGVGMSMAGGGSSGVSLTLGLHQNNGIGLSEPFPINAAQRFGLGLEGNSEGYVMGAFETQNRHFGRDHHVIGGQLLHDFVG